MPRKDRASCRRRLLRTAWHPTAASANPLSLLKYLHAHGKRGVPDIIVNLVFHEFHLRILLKPRSERQIVDAYRHQRPRGNESPSLLQTIHPVAIRKTFRAMHIDPTPTKRHGMDAGRGTRARHHPEAAVEQ